MDIRNFFGSTKKPAAAPAAATAPASAAKKTGKDVGAPSTPPKKALAPTAAVPVPAPVAAVPKSSAARKAKSLREEEDEEFVLLDSDEDELAERKKAPQRDSGARRKLQKTTELAKAGLASKYFAEDKEKDRERDDVEEDGFEVLATPAAKREREKDKEKDKERRTEDSLFSPTGAAKKQRVQHSTGSAAVTTTATATATAIPPPVTASAAVEEKKTPKKRALPSSVMQPNAVSTSADVAETATQTAAATAVPAASDAKKPAAKTSKSKASAAPAAVPASVSASACTTKLYFTDMKIAVTGVFSRMSRERIEDFIQQQGGKVSSAVSGKTSLLVAGAHLEDGREVVSSSKYRTALEKKVKILTEEQFFALYDPDNAPDPSADMLAAGLAAAAAASASNATGNNNAVNTAGGSAGSALKREKSLVQNNNTSSSAFMSDNALWVDKYRPLSPADLIGHAETARKLSDWLTRWNAVHVAKTQKVPFSKENPGAKAVLLSGPPGIGKSSLAHTVARALGCDVLEFNASDTRNKKEIESKLVEAVSSRAISLSQPRAQLGSSSNSSSSSGQVALCQRRVVVMDEVDGMGGSDRGGVQELIKVIKNSKIPIICICNDRQSTKIRSLANHCFDLRVKRPMKANIAQKLVLIAQSEGLTLENNAALMLVEQSGNDIRQALNALQMWSSTQRENKYLSFAAMKQGMSRIEKDKVLRQTPFDACSLLLGGDKSTFEERFSSFFLDYSLVPLLVQQNYIDAARNGVLRNASMSESDRMEALASAADSVSDSDLAGSLIRGADQHWEILPTQAVMCVKAGHHVRGFQEFPTFPQWLGKYSTTNKKSRLTRELVSHSSLSLHEGFIPMRLDCVHYMKERLLRPLLRDGKEVVPDTISFLAHYGLTRDDFMESMRELQFSSDNCKLMKDLYEGIDTQTKTALTRSYNSAGLISSTVVPEIGTVRKGKKTKSTEEDEEELLGMDGEEEVAAAVEEEEENEEEEVAALRAQLAAKKPAAKSRAKSTAKSAESTGAAKSTGRGKKK